MHAEHNQDNHRPERTGIKTTEQHCSWRDVYALMEVDPSIDSTPSPASSRPHQTSRSDDEQHGADDGAEDTSHDEPTVIA
jgi:hypothetical protein